MHCCCLQELQRNHQRVISRDRAFSASSAADSPHYSSLLSSNKDGASPASSPRPPSGTSSYTGASDRKDHSTLRYSPGLNGQLKLQGSPSHTPRTNLTSSTSPASHAVPKSKCSDVKRRKASLPLSSKQTSNSQSRISKSLKESEHKKCRKLLKKERKDEEKKRRKKKEDKKLSEKRKKRDRIVKRERKLGFKGELLEKSHLNTLSSTKAPEETRMCKSRSLSPENQGQPPPKNKHRGRSEKAVRMHKTSTDISCCNTSPQTSTVCRSKRRKIPKKNSKVPKPPSVEQATRGLASEKKPSIISSQAENRRKPADTLPSLLLKALAPLTTGCSVSLEQPNHGKKGVQGDVLNAPDLQPVAVMGHLQEMGDNLANTPPVLSWQGSPVSDVGEDDEDLVKGVMSRPVLQPSPTQCFSPPVEGDCFDELNNEDALDLYSHISDSPCATELVTEDEKEQEESHGELPGSLLTEISQHNTSLDDVLKSLTTFVEGQRVSSRGGPFGGASAGNTRGVKHSSSLAVGPGISCYDLPEVCPTPDPAMSANSDNQPTIDATSKSPSKSHDATDLREPAREGSVQEDLHENEDSKESSENSESAAGRAQVSILDGSLRTELRLSSVHPTNHVAVSVKDDLNRQHAGRERKQKQAVDEFGEGVIATEIKSEERIIPPSAQDISTASPGFQNDISKVHFPQENTAPGGKDMRQTNQGVENVEGKAFANDEADLRGLKQLKSSANGNVVSPRSSSAITVNTSRLFMPTAATRAPCLTADPLRMKALSMGLSKELKILLIKLQIGGRRTFNVAEVEEQRIPLSKISIENTAGELVRACK